MFAPLETQRLTIRAAETGDLDELAKRRNDPDVAQYQAWTVPYPRESAEQILIGVMLGFVLQLFFQVFIVSGQLLAMQMGLGFASMIDPANGVSVPVIGQFFNMLVILLFFAMNGHLVVLEILTESFVTLPIGGWLVGTNHFWEVAGKLGWVLGAGLLLVLPAITALLVVNLAFGLMTRAAPQLNIFSIGFYIDFGVNLAPKIKLKSSYDGTKGNEKSLFKRQAEKTIKHAKKRHMFEGLYQPKPINNYMFL